MKPLQIFNFGAEFLGELLYSCIRNNESALAGWLRRLVFQTTCRIDSAVVITNRNNFKSGTGCALYHGTYILNNNGNFIMGHDSHLGAACYVNVYYGSLTIGNNVAIGPHTTLIVYSNHYGPGKKVTDERIIKDIHIGSNVFIGANCAVLPGTSIADNVVIGAGSVIRGALESNAVYVGAPCKKIREFA